MSNAYTLIHFASVGGTILDFKYLDLSPWKIQGGFLDNKETKASIRSISMEGHKDENWQFLKENIQELQGGGSLIDAEYMNLLWPVNLDDPPTQADYFQVIEAIRVAHPSEVYIQNTFDTQYFKGTGICFSGSSTFTTHLWNKYEDPRELYLYYPEEYLEETNKFLAYFKEHCCKRNYITNAIRYYSESFRVNTREMAFICLCICLETIVPGGEQLSFRFRRNLAVLCAESQEKGKLIFTKAKELYAYRSKLVHSGMTSKDFAKFNLFFEYAQILASRMIVEMLLHDIPTIEELDYKVTELGYGDKGAISSNYKQFKGNYSAWHKVSNYNFSP